MIRVFWLFLFLLLVGNGFGQDLRVPKNLEFAGMELVFSNEARKKIQTDVDALRRSEKYFRAKVEKVAIHFPLIEKILKEEGVPEDFKYLVIQESALVGDAVSSANAIGYWQFKEPSAREVGLKINSKVDERMHLMASTRGAARYLKSNNEYFDNWVYALMAYNTGPGGALNITDRSNYGVDQMRIDGDMHWYVLKFFAHKIAFEKAVGAIHEPEMRLEPYYDVGGKTLARVASEFNLEQEKLETHNKWLRTRRIPENDFQPVIIPLKNFKSSPLLADKQNDDQQKHDNDRVRILAGNKESGPGSGGNVPAYKDRQTDTERFPVISSRVTVNDRQFVEINGLDGIVAKKGDGVNKLAGAGNLSKEDFIDFNDLNREDAAIIPGKVYYLEDKRNKPKAYYHTVKPEENLWSISQKFGMKLKKLLRRNRMREYSQVQPGRILWLRFIRPRRIPVEFNKVDSQPEEKKLASKIKEAEIREDLKSSLDVPVGEQSFLAEIDTSIQNTPFDSLVEEEDKSSKTELKAENTGDGSIKKFQAQGEVEFVDSKNNPDKKVKYHVVKQGETYFGISRQYGISLDTLLAINNRSEQAPLNIGDQLKVKSEKQIKKNDPKDEKNQFNVGNFFYYKVDSGDTMYSISREHNVTIKKLMDWNDKDNFNVEVGEKLKIKEGS